MKVGIKVILVCLICFCRTTHAVEVKRLYETEVIAKSEQEQDRQIAIKQALIIVLTRILAGSDILKDDTVKKILADASHYVSEFQYSLIATNNNEDARLMRIKFDEQLLINILRPGKLGLWNEIRANTLVWLVIDDEGEQQFFDAGLMPDADSALDNAGSLKALPMIFPMQDLKEKRTLSVADVLSVYSDHLLEVSLRYDVVSTLAGKMINTGDCWKAEWTLYFDGKIEQWRTQCGILNDVALNGFQGVYDRLSKFYAVKPDIKEISSLILKVSNIKGITASAEVTDYFDSINMVKTVTWVGVESGYNLYRIFYQGNLQVLKNRLEKEGVIRAENFVRQKIDDAKYTLMTE